MFTQNYLPEVRKYFLFKGMLTLFVVSTFEGWPGILYTSIDSFAEVSSTSHVNTINFKKHQQNISFYFNKLLPNNVIYPGTKCSSSWPPSTHGSILYDPYHNHRLLHGQHFCRICHSNFSKGISKVHFKSNMMI